MGARAAHRDGDSAQGRGVRAAAAGSELNESHDRRDGSHSRRWSGYTLSYVYKSVALLRLKQGRALHSRVKGGQCIALRDVCFTLCGA